MYTSLRLLLHSLWITFVFGQNVLHRWKYMGFDWESNEQRDRYIREGRYSKSSITPIDVHIGKEIFLTIPRFDGVPATVVTLNMAKKEGGGPVLRPYPDWSWTNSTCNHTIVSVYRVDSDHCGRLWVLDNGKIGETQKCPPKILVFDQETRQLLMIKEIPSKYAFNKEGKGLLVTPRVRSYGRNCDKFTIYIADIEGYGLIVWDGKDRFQRFESDVFAAQNPNFTLNGDSFYLADGIAGMAFSPGPHDISHLYFSDLASEMTYHVPLKELDADSGKPPNYVGYKGDIDFRKVALVMDGYTLYFCSLEDNALMSWDIRKQYLKKNMKTIVKNDEVLQFVSGLKSMKTSRGLSIYGLSNKFQKTAAGTRNINEYNFHIFMQKIKRPPA